MKLYRREVKYKWFIGNDRGDDILTDETEWMTEEEAKEENIEVYDIGWECCREYERFILVEN